MSAARSTIVLSCATALVAGAATIPSIAQSRGSEGATKERVSRIASPYMIQSSGALSNTGSGDGGLAGAPLINENFETFTPGPVNGQMGWTTFTANANAPVVSSVSPLEGTQSVELPDGPGANGSLNGIFSPNVGAQPAGDYTGSAKINIPNTGGADYTIAFQAPSQAFITTRVLFVYNDVDLDTVPGDILILDDPDGAGPMPLAFQTTGAEYTPGVTHDHRVEVDATAAQIRYYLDNVLIYTGAIYAGTSLEQAVIFSDNFHLPGEIGRTDVVAFEPGLPSGGCIADISGDGNVGVADLLSVIGAWGPCAGCPQDLNGDNNVGVADLLTVIGAWGPCP